MLVGVPDALEDDEAGELWQVDVEDDEIGFLPTDGLDRGLPVVGAGDVVPLATKRVLEKFYEVAIVVYDQELYESSASSAK